MFPQYRLDQKDARKSRFLADAIPSFEITVLS